MTIGDASGTISLEKNREQNAATETQRRRPIRGGPLKPEPDLESRKPKPNLNHAYEAMKIAEDAVHAAKQEAHKAQRLLREAEEVAKGLKVPARKERSGSTTGSTTGSGNPESLMSKLRSVQATGSGYVPPHLRNGYEKRPAKMAPASNYQDARRSNPGTRPTRSSIDLPRPKPNSGNKSPTLSPMDSSSKQGEERMGKAPIKGKKKEEVNFTSTNVFAMLPDSDSD